MVVTYGIVCAVSLLMVGICLAVDRKKDIFLLLMFISVFVCNLGHFLLSVAPSLSFALNANRLAYLGQVFLPLLLLKMVSDLCNLKYKKRTFLLLSAVSGAVLLVTLTPGLSTWYYNHVSIETVDGVTRLIRDYGPLHVLYYFYLFAYFTLMLAVIIYAAVKKRITSTLHVSFLLCAVLCNIVIWFTEQLLPRGFEFLTVSYIMSELFIFLLYGILQEYGIVTENGGLVIAHAAGPAEPTLPGALHSGETDGISLFSEVQIDRICTNADVLALFTERELQVLRQLLINRQRKEIADALFVTESTIKKHTKSIFNKLNVTSRFELYAKLKQYI